MCDQGLHKRAKNMYSTWALISSRQAVVLMTGWIVACTVMENTADKQLEIESTPSITRFVSMFWRLETRQGSGRGGCRAAQAPRLQNTARRQRR